LPYSYNLDCGDVQKEPPGRPIMVEDRSVPTLRYVVAEDCGTTINPMIVTVHRFFIVIPSSRR